MKLFSVFVASSSAITQKGEHTLPADFKQWAEEHHKVYEDWRVERKAFGDWEKAKLWMNAKAKNYNFELGLTSVADQNPFRKNEVKQSDGCPPYKIEIEGDVPESLDYRSFGPSQEDCIGPVFNQSACGNSAAFAVKDVLDSIICIQDNVLASQNIVDCANCPFPNNPGPDCLLAGAVANGGANCEKCYLTSNYCKPATCKYDPYCDCSNIQGCGMLNPETNEKLLAYALWKYGTMTVIVDAASPSFQLYTSGIYSEPACKSDHGNHVMTLVGYGSENGEDFWILKNSWGTNWGEKGFMRMARNAGNMCGVASYATYPIYTL
ncbi:unnamed protein product [Oikopleura dioica]|uniref:Peptidase C1A papain C-terminal domain-containing protein n=2 Tax=Oikopleura dioica TaxID=34765 RepID=E4WTE2_OIKDI|nr:unnamed protein product [Oikopleura dioica]